MLVDAIDERSIQVEDDSRCFNPSLQTKKWGPLRHGPRTSLEWTKPMPAPRGLSVMLSANLTQLGVSLLFLF